MAKNITIAEGSQAKNFNTVHKLRTNLIGGGTQYWVPEDEAGAYAKMSEKSITANGTYKASDDNKDGFSRVTVNVSPNVKTKSITENGRYYANDDNADGYSSVEVNVSGGGALITKEITENGSYSASSDGAYGYSQVNVNVNRVVAVDAGKDGGDNNEYLIDTTKNGDVTIITKTLLPTSIEITTSPNKRRYITGETIDITGMVVKAYKRDGTVWTSNDYPNGIIPNSELVIEPNTVTISPGHNRKSNGAGLNVEEVSYINQTCDDAISQVGSGISVLLPTANVVLGRDNGQPITFGSHLEADIGARFYITKYNSILYLYCLNKNNCNVEIRKRSLDYGWWLRPYISSYSLPIQRWQDVTAEFSAYVDSLDIPVSLVNPTLQDISTLSSDGMMVNVKWRRPQDNQVLVAQLPIKVSAS